jgi:hypothetical protein
VLASAPVTPASLALTHRVLVLLTRQGVRAPDAAAGFGAVFSYVLGYALIEAALAPAGADRDGLRAAALVHLGDPVATPAGLDAALELLEDPGDFAFGLDLLLEGLERRAGAPVSPPAP